MKKYLINACLALMAGMPRGACRLAMICGLISMGCAGRSWSSPFAYWYGPQSAHEVRTNDNYRGFQNFYNDNNGADYKFNTNLWGSFNAAGSNKGWYGANKPMNAYFEVENPWNRRWFVAWDVVGEMPDWSPYRVHDRGYTAVKAYPNIRVDDHPSFGTASEWWHGMWMEWGFGIRSDNWNHCRFNTILEIRCRNPRMGEYYIQLELMNRGFGHPEGSWHFIEGRWWRYHQFKMGNIPVYKLILHDAVVNSETWRQVNMNLRPFLQHVAQHPYKFDEWWRNRGSWDSRVYKVSAGVEIGLGNALFNTTNYKLSVW